MIRKVYGHAKKRDQIARVTYTIEFGFPLLLLVGHPVGRFLLLPVIGLHAAQYVLIGGKLLLASLTSLVFFDLDAVVRWLSAWKSQRG